MGVFTRVRRPSSPDLALADDEIASGVRLFAFNHLGRAGQSFLERTRFPAAERAFAAVLERFAADVVHVHHLAGLSAGILGKAADAGARVVVTIHDHALACPRGQRIRLDLDPCPVLDRARCVRCVRPAWIEAARAPDRLRALVGLARPGEGRRLFAKRDAHVRANLDRAGAFIAPSTSAAEAFLEYFPDGRERLSVIPHGFALEPPPASNPPSRERFVAAFFGTLLPSKGAGVLADVARLLSGDPIAVVAHGPVEERLRRRLDRQSGGRLEMRGPYAPEDVLRLMAAVDAVLVPSLWPETFSIVVREAWAAGRPVLASATGALLEAAGPERERAVLLPPGDAGAWAAAIRELAGDHDRRRRLAGPHAPEPRAAMLAATMACYMGSA